MTTTKELQAIVEELELIDFGDAASYLGEDFTWDEKELLPSHIKVFPLGQEPDPINGIGL